MPDASLLSLEEAYRLLSKDNPGLKPILLPIGTGKKSPWLKAWQKTTYERTQEGWYKAYFVKKFKPDSFEEIPGFGIGVLLGVAGNDICTIDCDSDEVAAAFESLNPWSPSTLQSRGARGRNFWVRIDGDIPPTRKFLHKDLGAGGEWRADGSQTVLSHIHPDTHEPYRRLNDYGLHNIKFEDIKWPEEFQWGDAGMRGNRVAEIREAGSYVESKGGIYALRREIVGRHLTVLRWVNDTKAVCICPGKKTHTNENKDETDCWVMTDGLPKIHCMHSSCQSARKIAQQQLRESLFVETAVTLPNIRVSTSESQRQLYKLVRSTGKGYRQGSAPCYVVHNRLVVPKTYEAFSIWSDLGICFAQYKKNGDHWEMTPVDPLTEGQIKLFTSAMDPIEEELDPILSISHCPIIVPSEDGIHQYSDGYAKEAKVWVVKSETAPPAPLENALPQLLDLLANFKFKTPKDKASAVAAILTPALYMGGFVGRHIPAWAVVADKPGAGKTFLQKIVSWIYNFQLPQSSNDPDKFTIGGMEEQVKKSLLRGDPFVQIDNIRGKIDSTFLESLITGEKMFVRTAYSAGGEVERPKGMLMLAGNEGFHVTRDMSTRVFVTDLLHQPEKSDWEFRGMPMEDYVQKNWRMYLQCVFGIIERWVDTGMQGYRETRSRFYAWGKAIDYILESICGLPPITQELFESQQRLHDPVVTWAAQMVDMAIESEITDLHAYRAGHLVRLSYDFELDLPGNMVNLHGGITSMERARVEASVVSRALKRLAAEKTTIAVGGGFIHFKQIKELREDKKGYRDRTLYILSTQPEPPVDCEICAEL